MRGTHSSRANPRARSRAIRPPTQRHITVGLLGKARYAHLDVHPIREFSHDDAHELIPRTSCVVLVVGNAPAPLRAARGRHNGLAHRSATARQPCSSDTSVLGRRRTRVVDARNRTIARCGGALRVTMVSDPSRCAAEA